MVKFRNYINILIVIGILTFVYNLTSMAQNADNKVPATPLGFSGLDVVHVGPLEITPSKANLVLTHKHNNTYLSPTIRFKMANTSLADVKVILFRKSITATDNLGEQLFFPHNHDNINSSGIILSNISPDQFNKAFTDEKGKFIILAPKQIFEAQLTANDARRVDDKDSEFYRNHRPKSITVSATIGIINIDNTTELRAFSFSELPVTVSAR